MHDGVAGRLSRRLGPEAYGNPYVFSKFPKFGLKYYFLRPLALALCAAELPWLRLGTGFLQPLEALERLSLEGCQLARPQLLVLQELTSLTALNLAWSVPTAAFSAFIRDALHCCCGCGLYPRDFC